MVGELQGAERSGIVGSHGQALVRRDASPVAVVRRYDFGLTCEGRAGIEPAREPLRGPSAYQRPGPIQGGGALDVRSSRLRGFGHQISAHLADAHPPSTCAAVCDPERPCAGSCAEYVPKC